MPDNPVLNEILSSLKKFYLFFIHKALPAFVKKAVPALKKMAPCLLLGIVVFVLLFWTGLGDIIGDELSLITGTVPALLIIMAMCLIPSVSPMLGPGLIIVLAAGVLTGEQIASGKATLLMALVFLLALDAQIGGSFIPPGFAMGENEPDTISIGVPGIVFTRLITVPAAVVLVSLLNFL